eukprot:2364820-Ditylum_brightwellii.AAC.1
MKKDYNATLSIKHLAKQIETAVMVAGYANQLYTVAQVLSIPYNLVFKAGVYKDACKEWQNKPTAEKPGQTSKGTLQQHMLTTLRNILPPE